MLWQVLLDKFGTALHAESAGAILTTATHWEDLEIQEEAESGSSVTSKIRLPVQVSRTSRGLTHTHTHTGSTVTFGHSTPILNACPLQPSWFVHSLLFQLCVEVNRVGAHALPRPTLQELLQACLTRALQHYHGLTQRPSSTVTLSPALSLPLSFSVSCHVLVLRYVQHHLNKVTSELTFSTLLSKSFSGG